MDPGTLMLASMAASAAGAGISAYGNYQKGQAESTYYNYQAGVSRALAQIDIGQAQYDIAAGGIRAQEAGLRGGADVARGVVRAAAGNIDVTSGSPAAVKSSQLALTQENEKIVTADAAHAAYGEEVKAASETAGAGAQQFAAATSVESGDIGAMGSIVGGVGSVSDKWYQYGTNVGTKVASNAGSGVYSG